MTTIISPAAKRRRLISCFHDLTSDEKVCLDCGMATIQLAYIAQDFCLSREQIALYRQIDLKRIIGEKKLYLILDLDHTLLHTINLQDFDINQMDEILTSDSLMNNLFFIEDMKMVTKLRPFVADFLKQARELFELCVYTMGSRRYAERMANLIDPDSTLFQWRIIAREDCTTMGKKGLDVVLADEKAVLIVDDTVSVWSNHETNLINIDGFRFFGAGEAREEREKQVDEFSNVLCVLKKTHAMFFDPQIDATLAIDRDVRYYLKLARSTVEEKEEAR